MTHEDIARALAELRNAARAKGFRRADATMTFSLDRYVGPCQAILWEAGGPCHMFYGENPDEAVATARAWLDKQIVWTPEAVAATLGIEQAA